MKKLVLVGIIAVLLLMVTVSAQSPNIFTMKDGTFVKVPEHNWNLLDTLDFYTEKDSDILMIYTIRTSPGTSWYAFYVDKKDIGFSDVTYPPVDYPAEDRGYVLGGVNSVHIMSNVTAGKHTLEIWHRGPWGNPTYSRERELTVIVYPESDIEGRVSLLESTMTTVQNDIATIQTSIATMQSDISNIWNEISKLWNSVPTGLEQRVSTLECYVNTIICQLMPQGLVKGMNCPVYTNC